jgi:hypothetical protein
VRSVDARKCGACERMDYWRIQLPIGKQATSDALGSASGFAMRLLSAQAMISLFAGLSSLRIEPLSGPLDLVVVCDGPPV